jgi:16S rRNA G966 N2-methylase RsmD
LKKISGELKLGAIKPFKSDVFTFLELETEPFDLIFADPPYDLTRIPEIAKIVFERQLVKPGGYLIVEHPSMKKLDNHPNFKEQRQYGASSFSFFSPA